ncbi:unnamed protein product [Owenia fusiformis]|uniref:BRCT domain-containing protein n=1 Tax=Owenia fusiformis TaxID=6347 RepID=A0A8S4MUR8_OWEFU|nr:unnamed protein product [Owenia fusiformis]
MITKTSIPQESPGNHYHSVSILRKMSRLSRMSFASIKLDSPADDISMNDDDSSMNNTTGNIFDRNIDIDDTEDIPATQPVDQRVLKDVNAYVEVRSVAENRSRAIMRELELLGANIMKKFSNEVTHVVFKDGKKSTRDKAIKKGMHLVNVLWVDSCKQNQEHVSEGLFPVILPNENNSPLIIGKLKKSKSMQPKDFDEEVANSAEKVQKRVRRRNNLANKRKGGLLGKILVEETQPETPDSPGGSGKRFMSPNITIPDTPPSMREKLAQLKLGKLSYGSTDDMSLADTPEASPLTPIQRRLFNNSLKNSRDNTPFKKSTPTDALPGTSASSALNFPIQFSDNSEEIGEFKESFNTTDSESSQERIAQKVDDIVMNLGSSPLSKPAPGNLLGTDLHSTRWSLAQGSIKSEHQDHKDDASDSDDTDILEVEEDILVSHYTKSPDKGSPKKLKASPYKKAKSPSKQETPTKPEKSPGKQAKSPKKATKSPVGKSPNKDPKGPSKQSVSPKQATKSPKKKTPQTLKSEQNPKSSPKMVKPRKPSGKRKLLSLKEHDEPRLSFIVEPTISSNTLQTKEKIHEPKQNRKPGPKSKTIIEKKVESNKELETASGHSKVEENTGEKTLHSSVSKTRRKSVTFANDCKTTKTPTNRRKSIATTNRTKDVESKEPSMNRLNSKTDNNKTKEQPKAAVEPDVATPVGRPRKRKSVAVDEIVPNMDKDMTPSSKRTKVSNSEPNKTSPIVSDKKKVSVNRRRSGRLAGLVLPNIHDAPLASIKENSTEKTDLLLLSPVKDAVGKEPCPSNNGFIGFVKPISQPFRSLKQLDVLNDSSDLSLAYSPKSKKLNKKSSAILAKNPLNISTDSEPDSPRKPQRIRTSRPCITNLPYTGSQSHVTVLTRPRRSTDEFRPTQSYSASQNQRKYKSSSSGSESDGDGGRHRRKVAIVGPCPGNLVMTSLHSDEQGIVTSVVKKLGVFHITDAVGPGTSHVVCGGPRRTLNVLKGIARGCWLVSKEWVLKSLEADKWLDEKEFEVTEYFPVAKTRREFRTEKQEKLPSLFNNLETIYVAENSSPPKSHLTQLLQLCGAEVTMCLRKATLCVGTMTKNTAITVSEQWVLDSITQNCVQNIEDYVISRPEQVREGSPEF